MQEVLDDLVEYQQKKLYKVAKEIRPNVTEEDILQPFDYPELENNPHFRYEEGILHGILSARAALLVKS